MSNLESKIDTRDFIKLYMEAEGNGDSEAGRFMLWCDDHRYFLLNAVRDKLRIDWLEKNMPNLSAQISSNAISTPPLREAIDDNGALEISVDYTPL